MKNENEKQIKFLQEICKRLLEYNCGRHKRLREFINEEIVRLRNEQ
jgi:hypothetical protein